MRAAHSKELREASSQHTTRTWDPQYNKLNPPNMHVSELDLGETAVSGPEERS